MSATAVISIVNQHRIRRALTWLEGRVPAEEELIVGATLDAANELARRIAKESGAAFGWYRLTLSQLAATIATPALAARGLIPLTRVGTEAIVARLVHRLRAEGGLGRYDVVSATPGFPRAVAGVIAELRVARVPSDVVGSVAPDLVPLIGAYEAELAEAGLADWPDVLMLATEAAGCAGPDRHRLIGFPMLFLDVPLGSEAEVAFVRALATEAPEVLATAPTGDEPTLGRIRAGLGMQIENLDDAPLGDNGVAAAGTGTLSDLQRYLFNEQARPSETSPDNAVEVFSAPGEGRECVEIARRVLSLAGRGIPFDRIAVLLRSPEVYRANLEEAFNRADIPVHFARGAVRPDPAGRAFCALLKGAAEGLSAQRFAEYLSLGQVPDAAPSGAPPEAVPRGDAIEEFDDRCSEDESLNVWLVIRNRAQFESIAGQLLDLLLRARRKMVAVRMRPCGVPILDRFAMRLSQHTNEDWAKWQLCRYAEIALEFMCFGLSRAAVPATSPEMLFEEGRTPTFGTFREVAQRFATSSILNDKSWGARFFARIVLDRTASHALATINEQRNALAHGRKSESIAMIKKRVMQGLQLDSWSRIPDADGELRLADWGPSAGTASLAPDQIGLFERWQKNALRYLVPETGEIFKISRGADCK